MCLRPSDTQSEQDWLRAPNSMTMSTLAKSGGSGTWSSCSPTAILSTIIAQDLIWRLGQTLHPPLTERLPTVACKKIQLLVQPKCRNRYIFYLLQYLMKFRWRKGSRFPWEASDLSGPQCPTPVVHFIRRPSGTDHRTTAPDIRIEPRQGRDSPCQGSVHKYESPAPGDRPKKANGWTDLPHEGVVFEHRLDAVGGDGGKVGAVAFERNRRQRTDHDVCVAGVQGSPCCGPIPAQLRADCRQDRLGAGRGQAASILSTLMSPMRPRTCQRS